MGGVLGNRRELSLFFRGRHDPRQLRRVGVGRESRAPAGTQQQLHPPGPDRRRQNTHRHKRGRAIYALIAASLARLPGLLIAGYLSQPLPPPGQLPGSCVADKTPPGANRRPANAPRALANAHIFVDSPNWRRPNCSSPWPLSSDHGHIIPRPPARLKVGSQGAYCIAPDPLAVGTALSP